TISVSDANGAVLAEKRYVVPPLTRAQVNDLAAELGLPHVENVELQVVSDYGVLADAIVIDNRTNDFIYVPGSRQGARDSSPLALFLPGGIALELFFLEPGGTFQMGSPETERGRDADET